jgi:sarcosine oxidase/L-pipecolate oxidase
VLTAASPEHAYLRASFANVTSAGGGDPPGPASPKAGPGDAVNRPSATGGKAKARWLATPADVARASGAAAAAAAAGYANPDAGWADAGRALRLLRGRVRAARPRVRLVCARADSLFYGEGGGRRRVEGVVLAGRRRGADASDDDVDGGGECDAGLDGAEQRPLPGAEEEVLRADLTILAAGAGTPRLLPRGVAGGRLRATLHPVAYVALRPDEAAELCRLPSVLDLQSGLFIMPPPPPPSPPSPAVAPGADEPRLLLKVARHSSGYAPPPDDGDGAAASAAWLSAGVPAPLLAPLRAHLARQHPALARRPFAATRMCAYADTPTGDWIVDFCPARDGGPLLGGDGGTEAAAAEAEDDDGSLFLATGGSGHAFKFLPVLGACVAARVAAGPRRGERAHGEADVGRGSAGTGVDAATLVALWRLWRWRREPARGQWSTEDGSRGPACGQLYVDADGSLGLAVDDDNVTIMQEQVV